MTILQIVSVFALVWTVIIGFMGLRQVETGFIGAVFRFGKFRRVLKPGLRFVFPFLERVEFHSIQTHQHELPDEPENIDRISEVLSAGKKHPFRVAHKGMREAVFYIKKEEEGLSVEDDPLTAYHKVFFKELDTGRKEAMEDDSLHAPLTSEIAVAIEWHLKGDNAEIENFIQNVSPEAGRDREEEIRKRIEDMVSRVLQEFLGPVTLGHAAEMLPLFSQIIKRRLEILVGERVEGVSTTADKPWGIHIGDAYIKSIYPGKRVNEARADAGAAVSKKQETVLAAEAKAEATIKEAEANRVAEQKKGEGEAARIAAVATVMADENARFIAALDVAEQVLPNANTIVVPVGEMSAIASILAVGGQVVKKKE